MLYGICMIDSDFFGLHFYSDSVKHNHRNAVETQSQNPKLNAKQILSML